MIGDREGFLCGHCWEKRTGYGVAFTCGAIGCALFGALVWLVANTGGS